MRTITLNETQNQLKELIEGLMLGETVQLTRDGEVVATLIRAKGKSWPCKAGSAKDQIHWISPDFNEPLEEFKEYME